MSTTDQRPGRSSSRDKLLNAAADLVAKHGVQNLTIDAVAAAANVTKGGLIYHFKTRDDLLTALVERMVRDLDVHARSRSTASSADISMETLLSHMMNDTFEMPEKQRLLLTNLLAAASAHPHMIEPMQVLYTRSYEMVSHSGSHAGWAMVLAAALDGIALLELLNLHRFTPDQRQAMREALETAIRELP